MRKFAVAILAAAFALSACNKEESYEVGASDLFAALGSANYQKGLSPLPVGLMGAEVKVNFQSFPGDRTAYWAFTRNGKEIARINAAVEGDDSASSVSYSYAAGPAAGEFDKIERQIEAHMPLLVAEAVDAKVENRPVDNGMLASADQLTATALMGDMMKDVSASMEQAVAEFDARDKEREISRINSQAREAQTSSTQPAVDLSKF